MQKKSVVTLQHVDLWYYESPKHISKKYSITEVLWREIISHSHCELHQYRNVPNVDQCGIQNPRLLLIVIKILSQAWLKIGIKDSQDYNSTIMSIQRTR